MVLDVKMCVVNHLSLPCSKCGAPGTWKHKQTAYERVIKRITALAVFVDELPDDCPIKEQLKDILNGT